MGNKNIALNHTLEQYNKKYRNRRHRLIKYTKKQVEDFDKQYGHYVFNNKTYNLEYNHYLLKDRKWALIGDTYYEIPKAPRFTWFRNLNAGAQVAISVLGVGVISSAVIFPTLAVTVWKNQTVTKEKWIAKADELVTGSKGFCNSTLEYTKEQITSFVINGVSQTVTSVKYEGTGEERVFSIAGTSGDFQQVAGKNYSSGTALNQLLVDTSEGGKYFIYGNYIEYTCDNVPVGLLKKVVINKYGYIEDIIFENGTTGESEMKVTYNGMPKEPVVHKTALQYTPGQSGDNSITYVGTPQASIDAGTQSLQVNCNLTLGNNSYTGTLYVYDNPSFTGNSLAQSEGKTGPMFGAYTFTIDVSSINLNNYETLYVEAFISH